MFSSLANLLSANYKRSLAGKWCQTDEKGGILGCHRNVKRQKNRPIFFLLTSFDSRFFYLNCSKLFNHICLREGQKKFNVNPRVLLNWLATTCLMHQHSATVEFQVSGWDNHDIEAINFRVSFKKNHERNPSLCFLFDLFLPTHSHLIATCIFSVKGK